MAQNINEQLNTAQTPTTPAMPSTTPQAASVLGDIIGEDAAKKMTSDIVSSEPTALETAMGKATEQLTKGHVASETGIQSEYERLKIDAQQTAAQKVTSEVESRRGFAVNTALVRQIEEDNQKSLRDLDLRKQQALSTGDALYAEKLADMQLKSLEYSQNAKQKAFDNLLSLAGLSFQAKSQALQERQITSTEQAQRAEIAMRYGVELKENDTLESVITRAIPNANKMQAAELEKMYADIRYSNAQTANIKAGMDINSSDPIVLEALARAAISQPEVLGSIKNASTLANVINKRDELLAPRVWSSNELTSEIQKYVNSNVSLTDTLLDLKSNPQITNKEEAIRIAGEMYGIKNPSQKSFISDLIGKMFPGNKRDKEIKQQDTQRAAQMKSMFDKDIAAGMTDAGLLQKYGAENLTRDASGKTIFSYKNK